MGAYLSDLFNTDNYCLANLEGAKEYIKDTAYVLSS